MKLFLKLKNWQLFILLVAPLIWNVSNSELHFILKAIGGLLFLFWIVSIGYYGGDLTAIYVNRNKRFFLLSISFVLPIVILYILLNRNQNYLHNDIGSIFDMFFVIVNMIMFLLIVYLVGYVSKTIAILEKKRKVSLSEWIIYPFLMMFFIFGVWVIQPKINKLLSDN